MLRFLSPLFLLLPAGAQGSGLGRIELPNSGSESAQEPFLRGALLLHSFEYEDAAEAFREAQAADPDFALAYWGEAMTHCHPIWNEDDQEAAAAVLRKLGASAPERAAKAGSERERGLLAAVETLYDGESRAARWQAYADAMARLSERFPDDHEITCFHALSVLGTSMGVRDTRIYMRAAAIAQGVWRENPQHPGALHYLIHSYDDPVHAPLGLPMARAYGAVAPAAAHALHMPSHIYVALGMWPESAEANEASSAAADARRARKQLTVEDRGFHSLWWLAYTYLQQGRVAKAKALLEDMARDAAESGSERTRSNLVLMLGAQVVNARDWEAVQRFPVETDGLRHRSQVAYQYARGLAALGRGERAAAVAALESMRASASEAGAVYDPGLGCCLPAGGGPSALDVAARSAAVMELELEGLLALDAEQEEPALDYLVRAADLEDENPHDFGPPDVLQPAHELLGEALLELGRPQEALGEFEASLARAPRRMRSLLGKARSAGAAGLPQAREAWEELGQVLAAADADFEPLAALRAALATLDRDSR